MRIQAIETGEAIVRERQLNGKGDGPLRTLRALTDRTWAPPIPMRAWLIEHPEGHILVDTGETARVLNPGHRPRWHPYYARCLRARITPQEELGPRLEAAGVRVSDIRWVVLTHMHTDHAGGLHHVQDRDVLVSSAELEYAGGLQGRVRGYLTHRFPAGFKPRAITPEPEPYGPFPRSHRLTAAGDVVIVETPGHTPGHLSIVVERGAEPRAVFTGDAIYSAKLLAMGATDGLAADQGAARESVERLQALDAEQPTVLLPTHDPEALDRLRG